MRVRERGERDERGRRSPETIDRGIKGRGKGRGRRERERERHNYCIHNLVVWCSY